MKLSETPGGGSTRRGFLARLGLAAAAAAAAVSDVLRLTRNGIYDHENLATEVLVQNGVREFLVMFMLLEMKGATGSPGAPIAVV